MRATILMALAVACWLPGAAWAQGAPPPPPDPAKLALATDILTASHVAGNMSRIVDVMTPQVVEAMKKDRPGLSDDTLALFSQMFKAELNSETPDMLKLEAEIYADHFTLEELKELQAFYASDLGRKMVDQLPGILADVAPVAFAWGQHAGQVAMARVVEKMKAQGVDIAGDKK
jgi:hypothetical protein